MKKLSDIGLVTYLRCKGFKIKDIEKQSQKSVFLFEEDAKVENEILKYYNHEAEVDPLKFNETLRNLKSLAKQG